MKQTNYHLFDFMDFSDFQSERDVANAPAPQQEEALWKAYAPTKIEERNGDIIVTIPYQKQKRQEDMEPDTTAPQQSFDLIIRAYEPNIVRLFTTMNNDEMVESDEMLQFSSDVKRLPLSIVKSPIGCDIVAATGKKVATIDLSAPVLDHWSDLLPAPQPAPFITCYPDGDESKGVALSDDHFSPPRYDALPLGFVTRGSASATERATISFRCEPDECFVGTGERFRKMDLSGQTFQLKNQDGQGVNNRRCYKNIPFYMSSRMYGCFYHTSDYCKLSLADHSTRSVQFLNDYATLDVFLIGGATPEEILRGYRMLTGFPPMLPTWSFGIWMSRMTYFSADEVNDICDRLRKEHYPCDVIHLDTGWFRTDWLCEWKFNPERFPDPKAFIQRLKQNGYKVSLWQLPYIAQGAEQLEEAKRNRYISRPSPLPLPCREGSEYSQDEISAQNETDGDDTNYAPLSQGGDGGGSEGSGSSNFSALDYAGTIDFTYDKATDWYQRRLLKPLLDMGVKCIKTDFGENIHMNHQYHAATPERLNNIYALLYQRAAYEVTKEVTGDGIVWARAAWAGCQRYPLHWGGDSESSWAGLAGSLKGGLHFGLSGFAFWSHDVPGFHATPDFMNSPIDENVYVRWTQFGVFTSHMRYHGTSKREPWHYPHIAPIVKRWWKLRYKLLPYILEQSEQCCQTGYPMVRALLFHHPNDRQVWHIDDEYFFGSEFLVCPVMNSKNRRDLYLPEGLWINFFTGEQLEGGRWYYGVEVPLDQMPVFVRPGARIKLYPDEVDSTDDMDMSKVVTLEITKDYQGTEI
jgi:alpha-D-xyloside xylohydrolase